MEGGPAGRVEWEAAAKRCVARLRDERGVMDEWSVRQSDGQLWVHLGQMRVSVDEGADVTTEAELWEDLDTWVALDRPQGPGRWLPRDEADLLARREAMHRVQPFWRAATARLAADLRNAWGVETRWEVTVSDGGEPEPPWSPRPSGVVVVEEHDRSALRLLRPAWPRHSSRLEVAGDVRPVQPELSVTMWSTDGTGGGRGGEWDVPDEQTAVVRLVSDFEDVIIEEVWGLWPTCPHHGEGAGMGVDLVQGVATWSCARSPNAVAVVGTLTAEAHDRTSSGP